MIWLQTHSGIAFDLEDPHPDMVDIMDIATALAYTVRFNGQTGTTYSVAEHCVFVSRMCGVGNRMWGLLHDAHEAYTGDIVSPMKKLLPGLPALENRIQNAICEKLGLRKNQPTEVKVADERMLSTEKLFLFPNRKREWSEKATPFPDVGLYVLKPEEAKSLFLREFFLIRKEPL